MKLISRKSVFLSSADKAAGDRGQFTLQLPYDFVFDEHMVFKLFISQLNMRNTFFFVNEYNSVYYMFIGANGLPVPDPPTAAGAGGWQRFVLPYGCYSASQLVAIVNEQMFSAILRNVWTADANEIRILYRSGRLYVNQESNPSTNIVYFYFLHQDGEGGSCHNALGFDQENHVFAIQPTSCTQAAAGPYHRNRNDRGSNAPPENAMSPVLMDPESISNILIRTSMPSDNYTLSREGPETTGVTINIPITVAPGAAIVYEDLIGTHAIYERARSVVNNLSIEVLDKYDRKIIPGHDWSFILSIEQYEDTEGESLDALKAANGKDDEMIQLLKMLLLQREFKNRTL